MSGNEVMTPKSCESCVFTMVSVESDPCFSCRGMRNYAKDISSDHEAIIELNRELVEGLQGMIDGSYSADKALALIAKARGEK